LDAYVSTYDTLCEDRRYFSPNSVWAKIASWLDRRSFEVADQIITDTRSDAEYLIERYGVSDKKISTVYVGCDESIFYPKEHSLSNSGRFEIFYYGSFLPLHGTEVIIRAAEALKQRSDIHFTIGGMGPEYNRIELMVTERHLQNVTLMNWIRFDQLAYYIDRADICLGGHFSTISKANRVVSTKTYQFLAKQKPTIVSDSDAAREIFIDRKHVLMVAMGDTEALAGAIVELVEKQDLRTHIAKNGYRIFKQRFTIKMIARQLSDILESVL
jgi:glycosyltransferase involved in cell wall biosynthesis